MTVSLLSALILLLLTLWLRRRQTLSKWQALLLFFLPLLLGNLYYFSWVAPRQQQQAALDDARLQLAALPVWRVIKDQQPALYQQAERSLIANLQAGMPRQQAIDKLRPLAADLLNQRINAARDEDLIRYMRASLAQMKQLRQIGAEPCFRFLFPQINGGIDISTTLPKTLVDSELLAMDSLLKHSSGVDRSPDLQQGRVQLQKVVRTLYQRWGSDLQTLNAPAEAGANQGKLCDMTLDLYQSVLALPDKDSATVLRIIISGTGN